MALKVSHSLNKQKFSWKITYTVTPHYLNTVWTRRKCRHKWSVAVTEVGETYVYKRAVFFYEFKTILNFKFSCIFKQ